MSLQANHYTQINMICKFYRFIKSRVGGSLKGTHCRRHLVPSRKQIAYQLPRTQRSLSSLTRVPRPLHTQDSTCRDRQHHSGVIHKQGRRHEVGPTLCLENLDLVCHKSSNSKSPTHSRPAECGRRQARIDQTTQTEWPLLQEVFQAICNRWHEVQQQVTGTGSPGHSGGCAQSAMVGSGSIHLPAISHIGQSGDVAGLPMQENH